MVAIDPPLRSGPVTVQCLPLSVTFPSSIAQADGYHFKS